MARTSGPPLQIACTLAALLVLAPLVRAQTPPPAAPLQTQESNVVGVVAELTECKRKDGVLTVKIRFRNTGAEKASFKLIDRRQYDELYATAGAKKYFVLRDSEKTPLAPPDDSFGQLTVKLEPGAAWTWWAKYPAPPAEVQAINYYTSVTPPFDDVPITDN